MMIAFTSFEAIFIIERFDDWAGTKSFESTSYWLWAAGFYVLARVEEVADKPIYTWTLHIFSGHTLGHLCAAMVPLFFILMLVKRTRPIQPERHMIVHHQLKLAFMICLLVPKMIYLWMPKLQVSAIMYEISILMWEFSARYVANQAKTSEERGMLETPIRARQIVPRIRGLYGMDIYKNKVLNSYKVNDRMSLYLDYGARQVLARHGFFHSSLIAMLIHFVMSYFLMVAVA
ncbi:uncharacterized protein [Triticum aestivum]|uniref:uncharacterized protein n=1 Tax=Triticum aestivum TaxID=4565 RepID=UPI001D022C5E|nr:uncharacterized protein LOC123080777 [Triticum aestivum]